MKKISILVPIYRNSSALAKFLEVMADQSSKNYELILAIDTNNENNLKIVDEWKSKIKGDLKIVFNSKRTGRINCVKEAMNVAETQYSIIFSVTNRINSNTVKELIEIIDKKKTDIIEFRARAWSPIKFKGSLRKKFNKVINIKENKEIFAYSYPTEFNKIFKTELLRKVFNLNPMEKTINSRYSIQIVFKALLLAETYSTVDKKIVRSRKEASVLFNPLKLAREWEETLNLDIFEDYYAEMLYNQYFTYKVLLMGYAGATKNKVLIKKFQNEIDKKFNNESNFFEVNQYYLLRNNETNILKSFKTKTSEKAHKEF